MKRELKSKYLDSYENVIFFASLVYNNCLFLWRRGWGGLLPILYSKRPLREIWLNTATIVIKTFTFLFCSILSMYLEYKSVKLVNPVHK